MDILKKIWAKQARAAGVKPYFCVSTKKGETWKDHYFRWGNFREMDKIFRDHPTGEYNLYFCPLPLERPHRRKEYVLGSSFLWADIDETDPRKMKHPPHILWESSPGRWAGLWATERWLEGEELEKYNRRMTYGTGSDKAGWDLTQVLRVPGTLNHKYKGSPEGRIVRADLRQVLRLEDVPEDISRVSEGLALEIYDKWKNKLTAQARSILGAEKAEEGKRSSVLWKLYNLLLDAGVPLDEIKTLIKQSVWNKYEGRRDEDKQLDRDIEKCLKERGEEIGEKRGKATLAGVNKNFYRGITLDKVEREKIDFIWWPYLSKGALHILEGDPGQGKSYAMQMICKEICDGGYLPGEGSLGAKEKVEKGRVYYLGIEDGISTVIKPRLEDNGLKNFQNFMVNDRAFTMDEQGLSQVELVVEEFKPTIIVFDTINYYIGGIDVHRANEVSQQLERFSGLAKKYKIAVVIIRHLTKDSSGAKKGIYRGVGSIAFTGTARCVLSVGLHPEEPDLKLMAVTKLNLEKPPLAVGFTINAEGRGRSKFEWSDKLYDLRTDDIIDVRPMKNDGLEDAKKFLREILSDGEVESSNLSRAAEARSISAKSLVRAKKELNVETLKKNDKWFNRLAS